MTAKQKRRKTDKHKEPVTPGDEAAAPAPPENAEDSGPADGGKGENSEMATLNDRLLRLQADFDNYRKRTLRERETERLRCNEDLMLELLPILDHLELGLQTAEKHEVDSSVIEGFRLVLDQALGALRKFGLEPIDAEGKEFDPHAHESVSLAPSETTPRDHVFAQIRRGYRLGSQLLRPAQVVVSTGAASEADPPETPETEGADRTQTESME